MWTFIKSLFSALNGLFKYLSDSQLIEAGRDQEQLKATLEALDATNKAQEIDRKPVPVDRSDILRDL